MITMHGARCDICGDYILPVNPDERVMTFRLGGMDCHAHKARGCYDLIKRLHDEAPEDSTAWWHGLPPGPLRTAIEEYEGRVPHPDDHGA